MTVYINTCKCEICGDVLMENFLKTHMRLSHPSSEMADRRKTASTPSRQSESSSEAKAEAISPDLNKLLVQTAPVDAKKDRPTLKVTRTKIERRFVTAIVHEISGNKAPRPFVKTPISPSTTTGSVCPKCGVSVPPDAIKRHLRLHDARQPVDAPSDDRSESLYAYSGGLPSLGKRAR